MSDKLPNISYYNNQEYNFQKPYSETTAKIMDDEVLKMINEQYERAKKLLVLHQEGHNQLAELLIEREVIFAEDVERIFGKRPWVSRSQEIMELNGNKENTVNTEDAEKTEGPEEPDSSVIDHTPEA
jgi:cell division protease FtsH